MHEPSGSSSQRHMSSYRQTSLILWLADKPNLEIHIAKVSRLTHSVSGEGCRQQAIRVVVAPQRWSQPKNACRNRHTRDGNRLTTLYIHMPQIYQVPCLGQPTQDKNRRCSCAAVQTTLYSSKLSCCAKLQLTVCYSR